MRGRLRRGALANNPYTDAKPAGVARATFTKLSSWRAVLNATFQAIAGSNSVTEQQPTGSWQQGATGAGGGPVSLLPTARWIFVEGGQFADRCREADANGIERGAQRCFTYLMFAVERGTSQFDLCRSHSGNASQRSKYRTFGVHGQHSFEGQAQSHGRMIGARAPEG